MARSRIKRLSLGGLLLALACLAVLGVTWLVQARIAYTFVTSLVVGPPDAALRLASNRSASAATVGRLRESVLVDVPSSRPKDFVPWATLFTPVASYWNVGWQDDSTGSDRTRECNVTIVLTPRGYRVVAWGAVSPEL